MAETSKVERLLVTGAAGGLGKVLRQSLKPFAHAMRLTDVAPTEPAGEAEEVVRCDLADKAAVDRLTQGCDAVVHLGGVSTERPFEEILEANIKGVFHIYEGARRHARRLLRWQTEGGKLSQWNAPEMIGCIATHSAGGWLCAMESGVFHLEPDASCDLLQGPRVAGVRNALPGMRFNDGRCDRQGRFRAGTMLMDMNAAQPVGVLYGLAEDSRLEPLVEGLAGRRSQSLYPFFVALCLVLMAVTYVPALSLWLPGLLLAR